MKRKRVSVFVIDNRKEFREKLERENPELGNINEGVDKIEDVDNSKRPLNFQCAGASLPSAMSYYGHRG